MLVFFQVMLRSSSPLSSAVPTPAFYYKGEDLVRLKFALHCWYAGFLVEVVCQGGPEEPLLLCGRRVLQQLVLPTGRKLCYQLQDKLWWLNSN